MGITSVLGDSGFDMALGYMDYSRSRNDHRQRSTSSWFAYGFSVGEGADVPSRSATSTGQGNDYGKP